MKKQINNLATWLNNNWKPITVGIITLLAAASGYKWKYGKQVKKAADKAPKILNKAGEELSKRTNEFGEVILWK